MKERLILTLSLGKSRNFIDITRKLMEAYAIKTNADFIIINDQSLILNTLNTTKYTTGRSNDNTLITRLRIIYYYLGLYNNVLLIDDSCIIKPDTEDLFKFTDGITMLGFNEGRIDDMNSWKLDTTLIKNKMGYFIDRKKYINGGVIVYTQSIRQYFSDIFLEKYKVLFESKYVDQAYINFIIQYYNIPISFIDEKYNKILIQCDYRSGKNKLASDIDIDDIKNSSDKIYHITGFYRDRYNIIKRLSDAINT
jgi:hypothetical protein